MSDTEFLEHNPKKRRKSGDGSEKNFQNKL